MNPAPRYEELGEPRLSLMSGDKSKRDILKELEKERRGEKIYCMGQRKQVCQKHCHFPGDYGSGDYNGQCGQ